MQIKKGPFGYFAVEKLDSPDKLCSYAEEVIAGNKSDFYLTPVTEFYGSGVMCCYEFSGYVPITDPEFSVFSSQGRLSSHRKESKNLLLRRRSVGDLFYSFARMLDNLISPSTIVIDPDLIFTDTEGITLKLCCLPIKSTPDNLNLSSLDASRLEKLLCCDFFTNVVTDDEKNALIYSVKENNEEMFIKVARSLSGTEEQIAPSFDPAGKNTDPKIELPRPIKDISSSEKNLYLSCLSAFFSLAAFIMRMKLPCILMFVLSSIILISILLNQKKKNEKITKEQNQEKSKQRSSILFSDNELTDTTEEGKDKTLVPLTPGKLTLLTDCKGINPQYSVYLDETYIGSDCFLSDIVLDAPGISPLHAVIRQKNGAFYLQPSQGMGKTYLEDNPIENGKSYEIKSGQKITIGDISFRFSAEVMHKI